MGSRIIGLVKVTFCLSLYSWSVTYKDKRLPTLCCSSSNLGPCFCFGFSSASSFMSTAAALRAAQSHLLLVPGSVPPLLPIGNYVTPDLTFHWHLSLFASDDLSWVNIFPLLRLIEPCEGHFSIRRDLQELQSQNTPCLRCAGCIKRLCQQSWNINTEFNQV